MPDITRRKAVALTSKSIAFAYGLGLTAACDQKHTTTPTGQFMPTEKSLDTHQVPSWFNKAKFGIFIHWGPYSVPAFAPTDPTPEAASPFANVPYAEWYWNTMKFEGSQTAVFHRDNYGADYSYERFGNAFNDSLQNWNPDAWARLFKESGARYVVLVAKHHDGFLLWPSAVQNPNVANWRASRDIVGELSEAVRALGMKFGIYYSGGVDWTFQPKRVEKIADLFLHMPGKKEGYTDYAKEQYLELIDRYRPDYLWNDIGYPSQKDSFQILADYYNLVPEGLTNDRWISLAGFFRFGVFDRPDGVEGLIPPLPPVWDVRTPEYTIFDEVLPFQWEATRGFGASFAYNRAESGEHYLSSQAIKKLLLQAAAFNGNLLLNVGPHADGSIDSLQAARLLEVGKWIDTNKDAVLDTISVSLPKQDLKVGAVKTTGTVNIYVLERPTGDSIKISLTREIASGKKAQIIDSPDEMTATVIENDLVVKAANGFNEEPLIIRLR
ncbi:MAG: alpha-L-fucosidase [Pseudomonadota bacterium]